MPAENCFPQGEVLIIQKDDDKDENVNRTKKVVVKPPLTVRLILLIRFESWTSNEKEGGTTCIVVEQSNGITNEILVEGTGNDRNPDCRLLASATEAKFTVDFHTWSAVAFVNFCSDVLIP